MIGLSNYIRALPDTPLSGSLEQSGQRTVYTTRQVFMTIGSGFVTTGISSHFCSVLADIQDVNSSVGSSLARTVDGTVDGMARSILRKDLICAVKPSIRFEHVYS